MAVSDTHKSDLLLVGVTLLAAISWMFSKEAVLLMPPLLFMALRFLIAGAILAFAATSSLRRLNRAQIRRGINVGIVFGIAMSCWIMGLFYGNHLGEGAFLTSLGVVLVPIVDRLVFRQHQPLSTWMAIPIAVGGLACLSLENGFRIEAGQIFFVLAACIFALFFLMNTRAANTRSERQPDGTHKTISPIPALPLSAISLLTVGTFALIESFALEPWQATVNNASWILGGWILASAIIGTAGRFFLQTYAQSLSSHSHGVVIMVLEPVWVAIFAAGWFGETMTTTQLAGCALIFAALLVNRWHTLGRALKKWLVKRA
ncbi:DMT family transporter [Marinobacter mobilis]|uniref:EamA-like transporter family protein n=1 Tax=Marinobacter mobilis TaxID=488533 RepID=A0A1H2UUU5_9GAMM|nr:DMT family transporter [Marinobacter mobilis]SDW59354.1 EamA-like transporter family protein [Marinobacter mobilis]